jgi:hypothetical protein
MEAAAASGGGSGGGLASPTPDDDGGSGAMLIDGGGDGGHEEVASELREQALGLISDAQTAGDRKEKEALLKQVSGRNGRGVIVWVVRVGGG